eukprot:3001348-Alexandrium_andersonii.AAC.1
MAPHYRAERQVVHSRLALGKGLEGPRQRGGRRLVCHHYSGRRSQRPPPPETLREIRVGVAVEK